MMNEISQAQVQAAIRLQGLKFTYGGDEILNVPEWSVPVGERIFLRGASGSGKSTLLNVLCGMLKATQGTVEVLGQNLGEMSNQRRDRFRARHMGVVFQQFNLIPWLSVEDNVRLAVHFAGRPSTKWGILSRSKTHALEASFSQRITRLMQSLNLPSLILTQKAGNLSIGQQQRVAVVRALINQPEILLVDEPTSALDYENRDAFMQVLLETVNACNATLLFVSHDPALASYFSAQTSMQCLNVNKHNLNVNRQGLNIKQECV